MMFAPRGGKHVMKPDEAAWLQELDGIDHIFTHLVIGVEAVNKDDVEKLLIVREKSV